MKRLGLGLVLIWCISACSVSVDGDKYRQVSPEFDLHSFFTGEVKAWGIVQDRSGNMTQRFTVDIIGTMENDELVLDETFVYGLGEGMEKRIWRITQNPDGSYTGRAGDIVGEASGTRYGNGLNWRYEMDLEVDDSTYRVQFDDWMWAFDSSTMINRAYIKKFGIVMAEVTLFMQRQ